MGEALRGQGRVAALAPVGTGHSTPGLAGGETTARGIRHEGGTNEIARRMIQTMAARHAEPRPSDTSLRDLDEPAPDHVPGLE